MFRELLLRSEATQIEAQSNIQLMLLMLYDFANNIKPEKVLFQDAFTTNLTCPRAFFRQSRPEDARLLFSHQHEPVGDQVLEVAAA
jgi:hypothetical protein